VKIDTPEVRRISNLALGSGPFALDLRSWSNSIKAGHSPARKPSRPNPRTRISACFPSSNRVYFMVNGGAPPSRFTGIAIGAGKSGHPGPACLADALVYVQGPRTRGLGPRGRGAVAKHAAVTALTILTTTSSRFIVHFAHLQRWRPASEIDYGMLRTW